MMSHLNSSSQIAGGPIISISDMDSFMRLGESAQSARSHRPLKKTSSTDFDLLRASGEAAKRRRSESPCPSPRESPCSSPILQPMGDYESRFDFMMPVEMPNPWKMTPPRFDRKGKVDSVMNVRTPFEITSPFEIGMASQLRIISLEELYGEGGGRPI